MAWQECYKYAWPNHREVGRLLNLLRGESEYESEVELLVVAAVGGARTTMTMTTMMMMTMMRTKIMMMMLIVTEMKKIKMNF